MSSLKNLAPLDVEMKTASISDIEAELNELGGALTYASFASPLAPVSPAAPAAAAAAAAPATPAAPAAAATSATPKASPAAAARAALAAAAARVPAATPATPKAKNPVLPVVPNADAQRALRATVKSAVELLRSVDKDELIEELIAVDATGALTDQLLVIAKRASTPKVKKPVVPKRAKPTIMKVELRFEDFYAQIKASVANLDKFADLRPHIVADVATVARIRGAATDAAITMELRGVTSCIDTTKQIQLHVREPACVYVTHLAPELFRSRLRPGGRSRLVHGAPERDCQHVRHVDHVRRHQRQQALQPQLLDEAH